MTALKVAGLAALVMVVAGACSGGGSAAWSTPKEVLDAVREAGFDCTPDEDTWFTRDPIRGTERDKGKDLLCGGFAISLTSTANDPALPCLPLSQEAQEAATDAGYWAYPVAYGDGYVVLGADGEFPTTAQPQDFASAFGATVSTLGELRNRVCAGNEVPPSPSASPSLAAPKQITRTLDAGYTILELAAGQSAVLTVPTPITSLEMEPANAFEVTRAPDPAGAGEIVTITKDRGGRLLLNFDQVEPRYVIAAY